MSLLHHLGSKTVPKLVGQGDEMKLKSIVLLAFAVGCGLVAMVGVQQVLSGNGSSEDTTTVKVLVALDEIQAGTTLTELNVAFKEWPANAVPPGAILEVEEYVERAVRADTVAGEVILQQKLGDKGVSGVSMAIPIGYRMVTVPVDPTKTQSDMLQPHDRVDVHVTYETVGKSGEGRVKKSGILLHYIEVGAVGANRGIDNANKKESGIKYITLILEKEQVHFINLAQSAGTISFSLRNKSDTEIENTKHVDENLLEALSGSRTQEKDIPKSDLAFQNEEIKNDDEQFQPNDVASFLNDSSEDDDENEETSEVEETPQWKITIYSGDKIQHQEVDLPKVEVKEEVKQKTSIKKTTKHEDQPQPKKNAVSDYLKSLWQRS